jgi:hypothetical protein
MEIIVVNILNIVLGFKLQALSYKLVWSTRKLTARGLKLVAVSKGSPNFQLITKKN